MKNPGPLFMVTGLDLVELNKAYQKETVTWKRMRLLVIRLAMSGACHREEVGQSAGCSLFAVASRAKLCRQGGLEALLRRQSNGRDQCPLNAGQLEALGQGPREGRWTRVKDMAAWARETFSIPLSCPAARRVLKKLGAKIKVPRRSPIKKARTRGGLQGKPRAEAAGLCPGAVR